MAASAALQVRLQAVVDVELEATRTLGRLRPYTPRRALDAVAEEEEKASGKGVRAKAPKPKPPDLRRLEDLQAEVVDASGVFVKAEKAQLGAATVAQFYGWQRAILKHLVVLGDEDLLVLMVALASCPEDCKVDTTGGRAPFARELASYLAHSAREEALTAVDDSGRTLFSTFFRALNRVLVDRARENASGSEWDPPSNFPWAAEGSGDESGDDSLPGAGWW